MQDYFFQFFFIFFVFFDIFVENFSKIFCETPVNEFKQIKSSDDFTHLDVVLTNFNQIKKNFVDVKVIGNRKGIEDLMTVSMFFRDVNNIEWCRDSNGILYKCPNYVEFFEK